MLQIIGGWPGRSLFPPLSGQDFQLFNSIGMSIDLTFRQARSANFLDLSTLGI